MDEQEVIRLAKLAGAEFRCETLLVNGKDAHDFLIRFADLVAKFGTFDRIDRDAIGHD